MGCSGMLLLLIVTFWYIWVSTVIGCSVDSYAIYHLRFEGLWTKERFPKVYPESRPKAHWSSVLGRTHTEKYRLFEASQLMTDKLKPFVELGDATSLVAEGQGRGMIFDTFSAPPLSQGHGFTESTLIASPDKNKVSLVVKIMPSPDWFVGVDSLSLCHNGEWLISHEMSLWPLDGGTQRGYTFSSPRWRTDPVEEISEITSLYPNHTADAFYYPELPSLLPIANVSIKLVKVLTVKDEGLSREFNGGQTLLRNPYLDLAKGNHRLNMILKPPIPTLMKSAVATRTVFATRNDPSLDLNSATTEPTTEPDAPISTTEPSTTEGDTSLTSQSALSSDSATTIADQFPFSIGLITDAAAEQTTWKTTELTTPKPETPNDGTHVISTADSVLSTASQLWVGLSNFITTTEENPLRTTTGFSNLAFGDDEDTLPENGWESSSGWIDDSNEIENNGLTNALPLVSSKILPIDDDESPDISYYSKECLVSEWSSWGECSKTCGYGVKVRTRRIVGWTGNIACPELRTEQLCGSMKQCNWSHFSLTFNSTKSLIPSKQRRRPKSHAENAEGAAELTERRMGRRGRPRRQPLTSLIMP